ncbi:MAG TPA: glycosyltransferase family A protein [Flavobacterium sp.]|nr:glycosyltransferase family A protein [Flavobacterium sp.]
MPFFSVIIPLYNKESFIRNTIESVLNQTFQDFEIIVINDGSTDKSEKVVSLFNDQRIKYYSQPNSGTSATRNKGIEKSSGNYIAFLDADDFWYPHFLEHFKYMTEQYPEQFVFSAAKEIETPNRIFNPRYSIKKSGEFELVNYFDASNQESVIWTSSTVFHKSVFEKAGYFDTNIKSIEDTDLWIRIGIYFPVIFSWRICARYILDKNSTSRIDTIYQIGQNLDKYMDIEKKNFRLKKFMDLNRYSLAIKSKISGNKEKFEFFYNYIDKKHLPFKKRLLLILPASVLKLLIKIKNYATSKGLGNSVFK